MKLNSNYDLISATPNPGGHAALWIADMLAQEAATAIDNGTGVTTPDAQGTPQAGTIVPGMAVALNSSGYWELATSPTLGTPSLPIMIGFVHGGDDDYDGAYVGKPVVLYGYAEFLTDQFTGASFPPGTPLTVTAMIKPEDVEEVHVGQKAKVRLTGLNQRFNDALADFDAAVATPDMMGKVGRVARVLGPRGLMPNPKTGTVTTDIAKAVGDIKGGKIEFRVDRNSNLNFIVGKVSFDEKALAENYAAALEEILRAKPSSSKGRYISKIVVSTTMGPGIPVDPNRTRNVAADDEADA